ncbi:DNA binding domain-containing protein, excisionase family [Rhizobiales bacterium GAS191]|nr:DNA binding domain-containing protein, excisionase family [Rhizobiales bacterium GAS191]
MYKSTPHTPAFMSLREAARRYGTSKSTLYRRCDEGKIRLIRHGSRTLVDAASIDRFYNDLSPIFESMAKATERLKRFNEFFGVVVAEDSPFKELLHDPRFAEFWQGLERTRFWEDPELVARLFAPRAQDPVD